MRVQTLARTLSIATLLVVATTGCHWFSKDKGPYAMAPEARPLEVPPDLDRPAVEAAMKMPATASANAPAPRAATATAASPIGFTVPGERDAVFAKVGEALAATQGLKVASKAQILGTYDVNYDGVDFLVRVTKVDAGVYISAVDPRGLPASGEAPQKLIASLKAALGG